jgi:hypothetical protein
MDYDQPVSFGPDGDVGKLSPTGFDLTEEGPSSWTVRQCCELEIPLQMPRQNIGLSIEASPFLAKGKISAQQLFVYINGLFQGFHLFHAPETVTFRVSRNAITNRPTRVHLVIPTAISPKALGLGGDMRDLGLAVTTLSFFSL